MNTISKTEQIFVVDADFRIWSGQRKLDTADIRIGAGGELPPEKVANLGNKRIVDPKGLNGFHRLKVQARRFLESHGMPFLGGYACPMDKFDLVQQELDQIGQEFERVKQTFLLDYDDLVQSWVNDNPEYANEILRGVLHRDDVEKRISFDYEVFKLQPAGEGDEAAEKLERRVNRLGDDLITEVAEAAQKFAETLFGKDRVSSTTSITLKGIRDKVDGLSFLNGNLKPLSDLITETLQGYQLNRSGRYIEKPFLYQVLAVSLILSDEDKIQDWADGKIHLGEMTDNVRCNTHLDLDALHTLVPYDLDEDDEDDETADAEAAAEVETEAEAEADVETVAEPEFVSATVDELFADLDELGTEDVTEPVATEVPQPKTPDVTGDNWAW